MKCYFSIARNSRKYFEKEVDVVKGVLKSLGLESIVFVDQYSFLGNQEKEMMQQAMSDIEACELFIAEVSEKAIGVGLEAGYAKGKGKTLIYLRHSEAEHSTTVSGISDYHLIYHTPEHLKTGLERSLNCG
jgi:hypothetical protein